MANTASMIGTGQLPKFADELEYLMGCAEEVLKRLGLAYRVVALSTGDTSMK